MLRKAALAIIVLIMSCFLNFSAAAEPAEGPAAEIASVPAADHTTEAAAHPVTSAETEAIVRGRGANPLLPTEGIDTPMPGSPTSPNEVILPHENGTGLATIPDAEPTVMPNKKETAITVSFAGDCTLGTDPSFGYRNSLPYRLVSSGGDYSYFFKGVKSVFESDDLTLVNLETTLTTADKPAVKKFRFRGDPSYVNILKAGSVEAVTIANNHSHDYLEKGFEDTVNTLKRSGITFCGWNETAYVDIKGVTVALIGYTAWDGNLKERLAESLKKAKDKASIAIVSMHWGAERENIPGESQRSLGHFCIDNGADLVVGHHPHVLQGTEWYKEGYIAYSLGNFCFGGNSNPPDKDSMILRCIFSLQGGTLLNIKTEIIPCSVSSVGSINDYQPTILYGKDRERVIRRIAEYSR